MIDLFDERGLLEKLVENSIYYKQLVGIEGGTKFQARDVIDELINNRERLLPFIERDVGKLLDKYNGSLLFEGAQGTLLDVDLGTYPFVTSSSTTIGGAYTGAGRFIKFDRIIGILKAYNTRVGEGPFPTEQKDVDGERLRQRGGEFGATTGRPRRCGWFDTPAARYAVQVNGINEVSFTKLDVLDKEHIIPICVGYEKNGKKIDYFPIRELDKIKPIYEYMAGWNSNTTGIRNAKDLPYAARKYIDKISSLIGAPIKRIGVGQGREQTISC